MAYAKTPAIEAGIEERRNRLISSVIDIVASRGVEQMTIAKVAASSRLAHGLAYKYFPDKEEMIAAAIERLRMMHVAAIREAGADPNPLAVIYSLMGSWHLNAMTFASPIYRSALRGALEHILREARSLTPKDAKVASIVIIGAARAMSEEIGDSQANRRDFVEVGLLMAGLASGQAANTAARYAKPLPSAKV
jgi:AcrR family transcriptional regulator